MAPFAQRNLQALAGYDWIHNNLANATGQVSAELPAKSFYRKIGVCGELIGGSLATMLALTECRTPNGHPGGQGIKAAAIGNPLLDWTGLFGTDSDPVATFATNGSLLGGDDECFSHSDRLIPTINRLTSLRNVIFEKPETYHDPFASPLLFFRTPSSELPGHGYNLATGRYENEMNYESPESEPIKKRRSLRKYPPSGYGLLLPHMRIEVGKKCVLRDHGRELIDLMRKSFKRTQDEAFVESGHDTNRSFDVIERDGVGLWDENDMFEIGHWLGETLRKP